jgi:hypothetical protein
MALLPQLGQFIQENNMQVIYEFKWLSDFNRCDFDYWSIKTKGAMELAHWLSGDVQVASSAHRMIQRLHGILEGKEKKGYIGTGNAHNIYAFDESLYLNCQFDEEMHVVLPITEAIKALEGYARFMSGNIKDPSYQAEVIEVSYDLEGQAAADRYAATGLPLGLTPDRIRYD